jgi:hypothetical protein
MAEHRLVVLRFPEQDEGEIAGVVAALREMAGRATSPVIRACLEEAADDIAHLTACGDGRREAGAGQAAR